MSVFITAIYLTSIVYGTIIGMKIHPFWIALSIVFMLERCITVRERGWRMMIVGLMLIPEMLYDIFLQSVQAYAFTAAALDERRDGNVQHCDSGQWGDGGNASLHRLDLMWTRSLDLR